jgi:hydrogenase/urease accessory protein HupE
VIRNALATLALIMYVGVCSVANAHESQPGALELREVAKDRYEVTWRAPIYYGRPHPARLELPGDWKDVMEPTEQRLPDSQLFRRVVTVGDGGVEGSVIRFPGLESTITDVFIRLNRLDGTTMTTVVRPSKPFAQLRGERTWYTTAGEYIGLGFHHILQGVDHLLFVLGLLLIVKGRMVLLKTITAFTVAHSITLAIATLGYASAPLPPLNAGIALSIFFLGPEIVRSWRGETSLTIRYPWVVAFLFGLLHGFGFASGLSTTGMPRAELPLALLFFNVGVELGQVVFVVTALALVRSFRILEVRWPRLVEALPGYAVGSLGAYWTIQRTIILLGGLR